MEINIHIEANPKINQLISKLPVCEISGHELTIGDGGMGEA